MTARLSCLASASWCGRAVSRSPFSLFSPLLQTPKPSSLFGSSSSIVLLHSSRFCSSTPGNCKSRSQAENKFSPMNLEQVQSSMDLSKEPQEVNRSIYPPIEPYSSGDLKVSEMHTLYWEQSGNPAGHRGAGRSTPHACLEENTTWDLVNDIEKLREHLQIPEWQVTGIILRGIFLLRKKELDWFYEGGAAAIFPDVLSLLPVGLFILFLIARHRGLWEDCYGSIVLSQLVVAFARIENHYFVNKGFLPSDSYLLDNVDKIRHLKAVIVQGRYDVCCPMMSAWDLHKTWPEAEFKVVPDAGHSANEAGIAAELVAASEKFKNILKTGEA
ncbi:Proline iminopeptidase [Apostasia shenzhenica]|uniref:Proline iminopeptidase n=1 Tax=Apostasia shenzhenica TaxID=1088818 RepID=A0A2I0AZS9_9ASPA|nr:Proline iminopeptidase [Apostasia shenzhenica]